MKTGNSIIERLIPEKEEAASAGTETTSDESTNINISALASNVKENAHG